MNNEIFEKLNLDVSAIPFSVRVSGVLSDYQIDRCIQIYELQEKWGGYPRGPYSGRGLTKLRNFGRGSLQEVELKIRQFGLPSLRKAPAVIAEHGELTRLSVEAVRDIQASRVLASVLNGLGRKYDPVTLLKVLEVTR